MKGFENFEVWFVTGAQLLYGGDAVIAVDAHSNEMVKGLNESGNLPVKIVYKGTVNSAREVTDTLKAANNDPHCIGVITWMHTFSPAKMWIHGLQELRKPPPAFPYAVQQRDSLGNDGYGFHEPQPVGTRRPRIRAHRYPYA